MEFSLSKLLADIVNSQATIARWQDFESLVAKFCLDQDPRCTINRQSYPDVILSCGYGIEAKSINSLKRDINLNSTAPDPKTFYVIGYFSRKRIRHVAIVSGANFYCKEVEEIKKLDASLHALSNNKVSYRTRTMWQITSPFQTWTRGSFIVDEVGKVVKFS